MSAIAEKHQVEEAPSSPPVKISEKAAPSRPEVVRQSMEAEPSTPRRSTSSYDSSSDGPDEKAISGLLRTIQRPLSTIGRIFSDSDHGSSSSTSANNAARTPSSSNTPRGASPYPEKQSVETPNVPRRPVTAGGKGEVEAARRASAETFQAQKLHRAEHNNVVETLAGMFPDLDRELISDVVRQKEGRYGKPRKSSFQKFYGPFARCKDPLPCHSHAQHSKFCLTVSSRVGLAVDACLALSS